MTRLDALFNYIGALFNYLGNYFWKTSPKWSKILGNFWNGTTFCHLGHFDLNTGDLFPNEPHGHTVWYQVGIWFWSPIPGETSRAPVRIPNEELVKLVDFFYSGQELFSQRNRQAGSTMDEISSERKVSSVETTNNVFSQDFEQIFHLSGTHTVQLSHHKW